MIIFYWFELKKPHKCLVKIVQNRDTKPSEMEPSGKQLIRKFASFRSVPFVVIDSGSLGKKIRKPRN